MCEFVVRRDRLVELGKHVAPHFYAPLFLRLYALNPPFQYTPFLNLRLVVFRLTLVGWIRSIMLSPRIFHNLVWKYHF